jgi:outer membrane receptor protein involved in Fe transport
MLHKSKRLAILAASASVFTLALEAAPAAAADSTPNTVQEVVVTAQKKTENQQDVPISLKAVSGRALDQLVAESEEDYLRLIPSVSMTNLARGGNQIQIRGLGSNVGNVGTVAVYNDGVISPSRIQQAGTFSEEDPALYDINRVEVLRGPQGTLYGEGSLGGVVNIISNRPNLDTLQASASATWFDRSHGSADNKDFAGMFNIPIVKDVFALRVVGYSYDHDGWINEVDTISPLFGIGPATLVKKDANTEKVTGGRALATFKPNEDFDATFIYKTERTDSGDEPIASPHQVADANAASFAYFGVKTNFNPYYSQSSFLSTASTNRTDQAILELNANLGFGKLTSISGYGWVDSSNSLGAINHNHAYNEELRLASDPSRSLSWIVGAYYRSAYAGLDIAGLGPYARDRATEASVFGQAYWTFAQGWKATLGVREEHETSDVSELFPPPTLTTRGSFNAFVPKLSIEYQQQENAPLYYATIAKGFRAGGANVDISEGTDPTFRGPFNPDSIWNYEIGEKSTFLDGKLTVNAALFYIDWSDVQIDRPIISIITPPVGFIVINGSRAHSYGAEADVYFNPTPKWTVTLGGSLINAGFDSGVITGVLGTVPLSGQTFSSTPKYTANFSVERRFDITTQLEGYIRADYSYRGSSFGDVPNKQFNPPYVGFLGVPGNLASGISQIVNLRTGVRRDSWDFQVFCTNLFDTHASTFTYFDGGFTDESVVLPPRTVGVNLKFRYN